MCSLPGCSNRLKPLILKFHPRKWVLDFWDLKAMMSCRISQTHTHTHKHTHTQGGGSIDHLFFTDKSVTWVRVRFVIGQHYRRNKVSMHKHTERQPSWWLNNYLYFVLLLLFFWSKLDFKYFKQKLKHSKKYSNDWGKQTQGLIIII